MYKVIDTGVGRKREWGIANYFKVLKKIWRYILMVFRTW
jgi:hypothetical protein